MNMNFKALTWQLQNNLSSGQKENIIIVPGRAGKKQKVTLLLFAVFCLFLL